MYKVQTTLVFSIASSSCPNFGISGRNSKSGWLQPFEFFWQNIRMWTGSCFLAKVSSLIYFCTLSKVQWTPPKLWQWYWKSHNDLPLEPEKLLIQEPWLSPYPKSFNVKWPSDGTQKLVETLFDKSCCVFHDRNLKFHVNHVLTTKNFVLYSFGKANGWAIIFRKTQWESKHHMTMRKLFSNWCATLLWEKLWRIFAIDARSFL